MTIFVESDGFQCGQQYVLSVPGIGANNATLLVRDVGAAPVGTLDSQWTGGWPIAANAGGIYELQNQNPKTFAPTGALVGAPHPHVGNIIAAAHYDTGYHGSSDSVMVFKSFTAPSLPYVLYASGYMRQDPNWVFAPSPIAFNFTGTVDAGSNVIRGIAASDIAKMVNTGQGLGNVDAGPGVSYKTNNITAVGVDNVTLTYPWPVSAVNGSFQCFNSAYDNNNKNTDYSVGTEPYNPQSVYASYGPFQTPGGKPPAEVQWVHCYNKNPDDNGHNAWWKTTTKAFWNGWVKIEQEMFITNLDGLANGGQLNLWQDGQQMMNYCGPTDEWPGNVRTFAFGGYARMYPVANNFRYFSDLRVSISSGSAAVGSRLARLMAGNAATLAACTDPIPQDVTAWSDPFIDFKFWPGTLQSGAPFYFHVVTADGRTLDNVGRGFVG